MADVERRDAFTFDADEITVLLKLVGRESPKTIDELGLDVDAFERVYEALSGAAYAPLLDEGPMSEFTALENAVLQAIRAGQEPSELRKEFEAILSDGWTLKLSLDQRYADSVLEKAAPTATGGKDDE